MKAKWINAVVVVILVFAATAAWPQNTIVRGTVLDLEGKPLAGATVTMTNTRNGRTYSAKTDKNGEFYLIAIGGGTYNIDLLNNGQLLSQSSNVPLSLHDPENVFHFDLRKSAAASPAVEENRRRAALIAENQKIVVLNKMLAEANAAQKAGDFEQAVQILKRATQSDPARDVLWAALGEAYLNAGRHASPSARRRIEEHYTQAAHAYEKAIEINPQSGAYHNNLGEAYALLGQTQLALPQYQIAAQSDPAHAAVYYFNQGAVLTNSGRAEEGNAAFDKAIAANPNYAEAYYQKAINLMAKATVDAEGRCSAAPEVEADLNKYLKLSPAGAHAATAREMLGAIGSKVETTYGKGANSPEKK